MTAVRTVRGLIDHTELGLTLFHEHLLNDVTSWSHAPAPGDVEGQRIANQVVSIGILGRLRLDPFLVKDNLVLSDQQLAIEEVRRFTAVGGRTIVDQTCRGIGRNPRGLQRIAEECQLNVVMGTGFYLEGSHPAEVAEKSVDQLAKLIRADVIDGVEGGIQAGLIGEIGISAGFTKGEEKVLRAAARAQVETEVPLSVHLPGWERHAHTVLDVLEDEGVYPSAVVLCHMNPSYRDSDYQTSLAQRGAWLSFDMIGMDYFYSDQQAQCPCDEENAEAIVTLIEGGWLNQLVLSGDTFVKTQLTAYGGFGYAHVPTNFADRLRRHGVTDQAIHTMLAANPGRVFEAATERTT